MAAEGILANSNLNIMLDAVQKNWAVILPAAVVGTTLYAVYRMWPRDPEGLQQIPSVEIGKAVRSFLDVTTPFDKKYWATRSDLPHDGRKLYMLHLGVFSLLEIASPEIAKHFYDQSKFKKFGFGAEFFGLQNFSTYFIGNNIAFVNEPDWSRHRVVVRPAFSRPLKTKPFIDSASRMIRTFHAMCAASAAGSANTDGSKRIGQSTMEFYPWMQRLTLDVLGRAIFTFDFLSLNDPEDPGMYVKKWNTMIARIFRPQFNLFPALCHIPTPWVNETWRLVKDFRGLLTQMIEDRRAQFKSGVVKSEKDMDLLDMMVDAVEGEKDFSMEDVVSDLCIFFLAGHDTTANVLSVAAYFLARHEDVQRKAREEVYSILGKPKSFEDAVTTGLEQAQVGKLQYINCVLKEAMRLYPSLPNIGIRVAVKDIPITYRDTNGVERAGFIPKGCRAAVDAFGMHYDPEYFTDPHVFNPDRWMTESPEEGLKPWMPFGGGPRICLGMHFSLMEQKIAVAMLLRNFKLELPTVDGNVPELVIKSGGLLRPIDLHITFTPLIS